MIETVMPRSLKFAVALLVLVILSVPVFAVATCIGGHSPVAAQMGCPAGCPMMAEANAAPAVQLSTQPHSSAPCCHFSNARPSPSVVPQTPVTGVSMLPQGVSIPPGLVPAPFVVRRQQTQPVGLPASPHSLRCVFLI